MPLHPVFKMCKTAAAFLILFNCIFFLGANGLLYDALHTRLLADRPPPTLPMFNTSSPVRVKFSLELTSLVEINPDKLYMDALGWVNLFWTDTRWSWSESFYNVTSISLYRGLMWIPDIVLYDSHEIKETMHANVVVLSDGRMVLIIPIRFRVSCRQHGDDGATLECKMKFGSWTHDQTKLDLQLSGTQDEGSADMSNYSAHPKWEVVNSTVRRNVMRYSCCPETYVDVLYTFTFRAA